MFLSWLTQVAGVVSTTGKIDFSLDDDVRMTLNSNGLGIGNENPASNIHVMGQAVVSEQLMIGGLSSSSSNLSIMGSLSTSFKHVVSDVSLNEHSVFFADSST